MDKHDHDTKTDIKRPMTPAAPRPFKVPAPREPPHHSGNGQDMTWNDVEDSSPSGKHEDPSAVPPTAAIDPTKSEEGDAEDDDEEESDGHIKPAASIQR